MTSKLYFFIDKDNTIYCFTEEEIIHLQILEDKLHVISGKKDVHDFINKCKKPTQNLINQLGKYIDNQIINNLIVFNTLSRKDEIENRKPHSISQKTIDFIEKNKFNPNLLNIIQEEDKTKISNKGFNLLYDFNDLVNGINPISKQKLNWYKEYKNNPKIFIFYAIFIICMQLFSDANHRTAKYLLKTYTNITDIDRLIQQISQNRQVCQQVYRMTTHKAINLSDKQRLFDFYENIPEIFNNILN